VVLPRRERSPVRGLYCRALCCAADFAFWPPHTAFAGGGVAEGGVGVGAWAEYGFGTRVGRAAFHGAGRVRVDGGAYEESW